MDDVLWKKSKEYLEKLDDEGKKRYEEELLALARAHVDLEIPMKDVQKHRNTPQVQFLSSGLRVQDPREQ